MSFYLRAALGLVPAFQKTKCKKLLNICMERIRLLEKRRQARVRQLHRDVIELLQLNKEHKVDPLLLRIWKELCLFSVYAKIAEYIGFVQMSLKDIAAQRECPSGLEEPLAGLCFAASCCAELPELQELREIFAMKYGKQVLSSGQDLQPNCHVNQQFLDCLYANDPPEGRKQALLGEIITKYNAMVGHKQDIQPQELWDSVSVEGSVDAIDCSQLKEGSDFTLVEVSEVEHQSEYNPDVVQEDLGSLELDNELASRTRTLDSREVCCSALKRAYRKRKFWRNKVMQREENGGKEGNQTADKAHMNKDAPPSEDMCIVLYNKQPPCSQPPQRPPPPPPPPKRAPPPPPSSLQAISMPRFRNDKEVNANTRLPRRCITMTNNHYLEEYKSHVHPKLPKYEDLVANFTALKR